jgi:hypothetical protein
VKLLCYFFSAAALAVFVASVEAKPPPNRSTPATIEQSGGSHEGDNVAGDQTKVIIHGNPTIVVPSPGQLPIPTPPKEKTVKSPPPDKEGHVRQVAKFIKDGCIIQPAAMTSQMFADISFWFGMSVTEFARIPHDEPPIYHKFTGTRPIVTPKIFQAVSPAEFDRELGCVDLVKDDCVEYDVYSIEDHRSLTREWATEWEDQERKGLLKDPDRLAQIVRCFSEHDDTLAGNGVQLWTIRLENLAKLLEQPQATSEIGAARRHSLLADTLQRWAHLLILRATSQPVKDVHRQAGDLFAKAADLIPSQEWLRKAAAEQFVAHGAYDRAADQQEQIIAMIRAKRPTKDTPSETPGRDVVAILQGERPNDPRRDVHGREVLAMLQLVDWRGAAGQLDLAQRASSDLRQFLDSADHMNAADRRRFQVHVHLMTGEIFAERRQWDTASEYFEAAADYAMRGNSPSAEAAGLYQGPRIEPHPWLLHAGALASFGENRARMANLDGRIRSTVPYFVQNSKVPTWGVWRYLMARWWSTLSLKDKNLYEKSRLEADLALERLLMGPVAIDSQNVPALDGLNWGANFAGGVFPASAFLKSKGEIASATTALLYRSTIEYLVRADEDASDQSIADAQKSYAMATDLATELARRIPDSGVFLEIAVLRAEARFLQEHQLNPVRSLQLTELADVLRAEFTCGGDIQTAYHDNPKQLLPNGESKEKKTIVGPVPLLCPFVLEAGPSEKPR